MNITFEKVLFVICWQFHNKFYFCIFSWKFQIPICNNSIGWKAILMVFCNFHFFLIYRLHNFPNVSFGFDHTHKIFSPHPFYIEISFLNILEWFYNLAKLPQCKYYLFVDDISFEHFFLLYTKSNFQKHGFLSNNTCI